MLFGFWRLRGLVFFPENRNELSGNFALALVLHVEEAEEGKNQRADEVDEQIFHGVKQANIEIAVDVQQLTVDSHALNVPHLHGNVAGSGVEIGGCKVVDDGVLLHIHAEEIVHGKFKELPEHADGHGEAEGGHGTVGRGHLELDAAVLIENIDHGEADGGGQKAAGGMEHGVPIGMGDVIAVQLAQNGVGKDEQKNDDLQSTGQFDVQLVLHKNGHQKQQQRQHTHIDAFKLPVEDRPDQNGNHNDTQNHIQGNDAFWSLRQGFLERTAFFLFLLFFHPWNSFQILWTKLYRKMDTVATPMGKIWNGIGNPVYPPAKDELAKHGITCDGKRAVQLQKSDYEKYDYFICMDSNNIRNIARIFKDDPQKKISKLMDYTDRGGDVADPWYSRRFDIAYKDIYDGCKGLFEKLTK